MREFQELIIGLLIIGAITVPIWVGLIFAGVNGLLYALLFYCGFIIAISVFQMARILGQAVLEGKRCDF